MVMKKKITSRWSIIQIQEGLEPASHTDNPNKISIIPLVFLIFYDTSGGPFGIEYSVRAAGPLLALLGFLLFGAYPKP